MAQNKKLQLEINIPATVLLVKNKPFKSGTSEYGGWHGYNLKVNGEEFTFFANDQENEQLQCFDPGTTLIMVKKEVQQPGKKPYRVTEIKQAIFDDQGKEPPAGKPAVDLVNDKEAFENYRIDRRTQMVQALKDAADVVSMFNEDKLPTDLDYLNREDIRAIGISFMIDFGRRTR